MPLRVLLHEVVDQQRNVFAPIGQPRQIDRHDFQPMVQIFAKRAGGNRLLQVAIRGRQNPHIHFHRLVRADARDLAALQHAQQLDLRRNRHVADFVQKQRAAVGVFEFALPIGRRIGERAANVAEQLALQNVLAQRRTIERHERPLLPRAVLMNRLGDQLLAGARVALDQHGGVGRRDPLQPRDHVVHLRAVADDALEAEPLVEPAMQLGVRPPQILAAGRVFDHRPQLLQIERLQADS